MRAIFTYGEAGWGTCLRRQHLSTCIPTMPRLLRHRRAVSASAVRRSKTAIVPGQFDVVLSSGFLAFANHSGFLQSIEDAGLEIGGIMGTSAGAITGSLYCAGYSPREIAAELSREKPITYLRPGKPWKGGMLSLDGLVEKLREYLPATFEELERDFAVAVVTKNGQYLVLDKGPLPEAVAASAAVPVVFQNVRIPGLSRQQNPCKDGGLVDRVGLTAWRDRRRAQLAAAGRRPGQVPHCLVHVIQRSSNFSGADDVSASGEADITTVYSPKATQGGVNLMNLGDFESSFDAAVRRASPAMQELRNSSRGKWWLWGN